MPLTEGFVTRTALKTEKKLKPKTTTSDKTLLGGQSCFGKNQIATVSPTSKKGEKFIETGGLVSRAMVETRRQPEPVQKSYAEVLKKKPAKSHFQNAPMDAAAISSAMERVNKADDGLGGLVMSLFNARTTAHTMHLQTSSYAQHKALDEFYNEIVTKTDDFVEAYQGKYGLITSYPAGVAPLVNVQPIPFLENFKDNFAGQRKLVSKDDTELQNLMDEIASLIDSTLYKLKNLS